MMATMTTNNRLEPLEVIEWDIPISEMHGNEADVIDFGKLSMGTELRNKMWETDNKVMLNSYHQNGSSSSSSPLLDQNQNFTNGFSHFITGYQADQLHQNDFTVVPASYSESTFSRYQPQPQIATTLQGNSYTNGHQFISSSTKTRKGQPLLQSPVPMPNDRKTPELLSQQDNNVNFDDRRVNESQTIKEELLEMKSIFTKLASQTDDILGLPEPVQLALKVIRLEGQLQDRDNANKSLDDTIQKLTNDIEKMKHEHDYEMEKQKNEIHFLSEKLDYKVNLDAKLKGMKQGDRCTSEAKQIVNLKEELLDVAENKDKKIKELSDWKNANEHKMRMIEMDASNTEKEVVHLKTLLNEQLTIQQNKKTELEKYITAAREAMERERQDRYLLLVEQNKLKHKVEKLSETCKSYQLKNEELCRIQNELEQECDQFRKLKKMIQEHGLPNHEQLIMLQQQTEMFKDDVLSERKDRERAQAQREKLRRDLEILQSRNQSLQEQVYKYQEHIMRLNTGDRRYNHHQEFLMSQQNNGKFVRQFSSPSYYNPKIRAPPNMAPNMAGSMMKASTFGGSTGSLNQLTTSKTEGIRLNNGFTSNYSVRPAATRAPQGYSNGNHFDPWQQKTQQHVAQQRSNGNTLHNINRAPRSPLLGPNGDPWVLPPTSNSPPQMQHHINSPLGYNTNIWSQQHPASPIQYNVPRSAGPTSQSNWTFSTESTSVFTPQANETASVFTPQANENAALKAIPGGETWSTASDEIHGHTTPESSASKSSPKKLDSDNQDVGSKNESSTLLHGVGGFQCGKCNLKFQDTESFRGHVEKCFN